MKKYVLSGFLVLGVFVLINCGRGGGKLSEPQPDYEGDEEDTDPPYTNGKKNNGKDKKNGANAVPASPYSPPQPGPGTTPSPSPGGTGGGGGGGSGGGSNPGVNLLKGLVNGFSNLLGGGGSGGGSGKPPGTDPRVLGQYEANVSKACKGNNDCERTHMGHPGDRMGPIVPSSGQQDSAQRAFDRIQ